MKAMGNTDAEFMRELERIIENIKSVTEVERIILFGSHARGTARNESDIDLCVITSDERRKVEIIRDIQKAVYKAATRPIDIIVYRPGEFSYRSYSVATIEKTIAEKGVVVYG